MKRERLEPAVPGSAYFQHLCDSAGLALLSLDDHLEVTYCNSQAAELLGAAVADILHSPIERIVGREEVVVLEHLARRAIQEGEVGRHEFRHHLGDDGDRVLAMTVSPIRDDADQVLGASACLIDITGCIHSQEQVAQTRKMRALGAMAGNFAHHFNNILGGVVTSVDFAKESHDARVLKKTLSSAATSLQRATLLLDELLAFAEADFRDTDLADLTETVLYFVDRLRPELERRDIRFDLKLARLPVVEVPRKNFLTVLQNLANNALDAISDGGRFAVELEPDAEQVICRITDSGPGIVREDIEHVFEPFYSTKDAQSGGGPNQHAGLGLSVALGIVHDMGGDIAISSRPGDATVVEVRLPMQRNEPPDAPQQLDQKPSLATTTADPETD